MTDDQDRATEPEQPDPPAPTTPQHVTHIDSVQGTVNIGPMIQAGRPTPGVAEDLDDSGYDLGTIRRLLTASFTAEELRRFCQDRSLFRPIVYRFGPGHGLDDMVQEVIDYCAKRLLWEDLLAAVEEENPRQYRRFEPALRPELPDEPPDEPPDAASDARFVGLRQRIRSFAPEAVQAEAISRAEDLVAALAATPLDLDSIESAWRWFDGEVPALSGTVLRLILDAGRQLEAQGDDETWAEIQQRFDEL